VALAVLVLHADTVPQSHTTGSAVSSVLTATALVNGVQKFDPHIA